MPALTFGNSSVNYEVIRSARRSTVGIEIASDSRLLVRAPNGVDLDRIHDIVISKAPWILGRLSKVKAIRQTHTGKEFVSGESFPYLGRNYRLKVIEDGSRGDAALDLRGGRFRVVIGSGLDSEIRKGIVRDTLRQWYQKRAEAVLTAKAEALSKQIGVHPSRVVVKNQAKRWGSCSRKGTLNLNWRLVLAPTSIVEYVVAHELCHLKIHDHSKYFWQSLGAILPDFEKRREWLRFNGASLFF